MSGIVVSPPVVPSDLVGQAIWLKLVAGQGGIIEVVGDSTSDDGTNEWAGLMAADIALVLPRLKVQIVTWTDGGASWPAVTVLQAGDGTFGTLTVYNCSVGGKATHYFLAPNFNAMIADVQPDLVFINLGHNQGNTATAEPFWRDDLVALGETVTRQCPSAEVVALTQNPRGDAGAANQAARRHVTMRVARMRGWGVIDTYRVFLNADGTTDTSLIDVGTIHPNAAGEAAMWGEIKRRFQYVPGGDPRSQQESSLLRPVTTALLNADFATFAVPPTLTSWTATQCTPSKDVTNFESPNGWAVRLVSASAATSYIEQSITGNALKPFLGQLVCFAARVRIPSGQNSNVGRVHIRTTGGSNTISLNSLATADGQGGFVWRTVAGRVDPSAGTLWCRVYCENGTTNTGDVSVDRVCLAQGLLPRDLR